MAILREKEIFIIEVFVNQINTDVVDNAWILKIYPYIIHDQFYKNLYHLQPLNRVVLNVPNASWINEKIPLHYNISITKYIQMFCRNLKSYPQQMLKRFNSKMKNSEFQIQSLYASTQSK